MSCCAVPTCNSPGCLQLTERETQVCATICSSPEPVAFSAIKEAVGFHQEVVSRILRRLLNYRAVEKVEGKYRQVGQ
ncbi:MAG: hypothetical protein JRN28_03200 [Nitrososphaerota archaeon]|nr:hypothetical protein [Nitrososphaerota archaeon]